MFPYLYLNNITVSRRRICLSQRADTELIGRRAGLVVVERLREDVL
jgi:hypothetical protein